MSIWDSLKSAFQPRSSEERSETDAAAIPEPESSEVNLPLLRQWREKGESHYAQAHLQHDHMVAFSYGAKDSQWDPKVLEMRRDKLPVLQFGFINGMVLQVVNPVRENPPGIAFRPVGMSQQAKMDARILTGVARADERRNDAESIYLEAFELQTRGGFGAWWYQPVEHNGEWKIKIAPLDPTCIIQDPASREDPRWQIVHIRMTEYEYRRKYPDGVAKAENGVVSVYSAFVKDSVTVIGPPEIQPDETIRPSVSQRERVRHFVFDNDSPEILHESTEYRGTELPTVIEEAPSAVIEMERIWFPLTHHAHEQQRARNFWLSDATFEQSSKPKNKWIADEDALINQNEWNGAASSPRTALFKKKGSEVIPNENNQAPSGFLDLADAMLNDARVATGVYPDPSVQQRLDNPSGVAIKQQRQGSGVANYQHLDQHKKALRRGAKIHFDLIRAYYNDDQIRESLGMDGSVSRVSIGPTKVEGVANIDLSQAEYLVDIDTGPSQATQREEATEQWMDFAKSVEDPTLRPLITYWLLKLSVLQRSEDMADWYLETLPPNLQKAIKARHPEDDSGDPAEQLKGAQRLIEQLKDHLAQTTEALQHANQELTTKQPEIESRERIAAANQQAETEREHLRIEADHIASDAQTERDVMISQIEAKNAEALEGVKAEFAQQLEELRGMFMLEKQDRENRSDAVLASRENADVDVIA